LSGTLLIKNRQRAILLNTRLLKTITKSLLTDLLELETYELGISIVRAPEMACLNETFLQHEGSTDVITFDYTDNVLPTSRRQMKSDLPARRRKHVYGEIFICIDDTLKQAKEFRASWQSELARYVIHGVLHLRGFDDLRPADRRKMKREENRLLKEITRLFPLSKLGHGSRLAA
jgi:probable rRNA maturation factor